MSSADELWAQSGAMALTGRADGPPLLPVGGPAAHLRDLLDRLHVVLSRLARAEVELPGVELLGERAALAGLSRRGPRSCGGAFQIMATDDGWWGLSLPRDSDLDAVPALVESEVEAPWDAIADWSRTRRTRDVVERARLLDLPAAAGLPVVDEPERPAVISRLGGSRAITGEPLVVDFTAMWAGPLAAHLLQRGGARVVKVELISRVDGARQGPREFYDLLHAGQYAILVDATEAAELAALRRLVGRADLVLEGSRPEALTRLGLDRDRIVAAGTSWVSLTAAGRTSRRVGFGDDVAAGAGLVAWEPGASLPVPCGDAIADPLAGVAMALAGAEALTSDRVHVADISMHHVCLAAAQRPVTDRGGGVPDAAPPYARPPAGIAPEPGAHNEVWLA